MNKIAGIKIVAFDADDTLWVNEPYFRAAEIQFCQLLEDFMPLHSTNRELLKTEIANLKLYGYGIKSFMLSMIETAIEISGGTISNGAISKMISIGKEMLDHPIELLDGVVEVLNALQGRYKLVMATKGDLLDQERKLNKSGLSKYFHHIEIVSEKNEPEYLKLIKHLDISPNEFAMIGNSIKSDIIPIVKIGGHGFHVPYHTTWEHEVADSKIHDGKYLSLNSIAEVLTYL